MFHNNLPHNYQTAYILIKNVSNTRLNNNVDNKL